jgi:hypothetical protein
MFGVVPGQKYGWPKNLLHWHGINESILDICATVPIHFVIADGVVAMEGNGPLQGTARVLGKVVLADDPVAADATWHASWDWIQRESSISPRRVASWAISRRAPFDNSRDGSPSTRFRYCHNLHTSLADIHRKKSAGENGSCVVIG